MVLMRSLIFWDFKYIYIGRGNCVLLGYYAVIDVLGLTGCPETSVRKTSK